MGEGARRAGEGSLPQQVILVESRAYCMKEPSSGLSPSRSRSLVPAPQGCFASAEQGRPPSSTLRVREGDWLGKRHLGRGAKPSMKVSMAAVTVRSIWAAVG